MFDTTWRKRWWEAKRKRRAKSSGIKRKVKGKIKEKRRTEEERAVDRGERGNEGGKHGGKGESRKEEGKRRESLRWCGGLWNENMLDLSRALQVNRIQDLRR